MLTKEQIPEVLDHPLYDEGGSKVGDVKHVFLDDETGRPEWLGIQIGLLGNKETFVPTSGAEWVSDHVEAEWEKDLLAYRDRYPWLVAEDGGEVAGVAYAKPWNPREAYDWTAESTIYVAKDHGGKRIGRKLYGRLFELLERQGFRSVMAQVTQPNPGSEKLHAAFGFERLGVIRGAGYKHGRWLDVCLWQKELTDPGDPPASPTPVER
jgi:phosphinothricin acetyltransferase